MIMGKRMWKSTTFFLATWVLAFQASAFGQGISPQDTVAGRGFFYVGGHYVGAPGKEIMQGQMYVEVLVPKEKKHPYPLVLVHGAGQTATNWMMTPDGREGWADFFVGRGYTVYMVDQPARGRSAWHPDVDGPLRVFTAPQVERQFTAPENFGAWPQASKHSQWPGDGPHKGQMGDPIFDAFYRTQVPSLAGDVETQQLMREAGAVLLDRIGPAILLTHSQGGVLGWTIADARPQLIKGILALEPSGPPFENAVTGTGKARAWGVTDIPLAYDPPAAAPEDLVIEKESKADAANLQPCILQKEPVRKLKNLMGIPVLLATSEASYHAVYDHCTVKFLKQAGVSVDFVRLEDMGLTGNAHMMMLEKNSLDIAEFVDRWASDHIQ
jgi:pimeloyl-ACP methyl ester carboxylesterase